MAKMVTRTVITSEVHALVFDKESKENKETVILMGEKFTAKELNKAANERGYILLEVLMTSTNETLYGMTEDDFIKYSVVLPPRGTKA